MFSCIILHDSLTNHLNMIVKNLALFGERAGEHFALFPKPKEPFMIQKRAEVQFPFPMILKMSLSSSSLS